MFKKIKEIMRWANEKRPIEEAKLKEQLAQYKKESIESGITLVLYGGREIQVGLAHSLLVRADIHRYGLHSSRLIRVNGMRIPLKSISYYYDTDKKS